MLRTKAQSITWDIVRFIGLTVLSFENDSRRKNLFFLISTSPPWLTIDVRLLVPSTLLKSQQSPQSKGTPICIVRRAPQSVETDFDSFPARHCCGQKLDPLPSTPLLWTKAQPSVRYYPLWSMGLTILDFKRHLTWEGYIVADKGSVRHVRYCPLRPIDLIVLPFKKGLTWKGFFSPYKRESPLTQGRCGTIGALHIIRITIESSSQSGLRCV